MLHNYSKIIKGSVKYIYDYIPWKLIPQKYEEYEKNTE